MAHLSREVLRLVRSLLRPVRRVEHVGHALRTWVPTRREIGACGRASPAPQPGIPVQRGPWAVGPMRPGQRGAASVAPPRRRCRQALRAVGEALDRARHHPSEVEEVEPRRRRQAAGDQSCAQHVLVSMRARACARNLPRRGLENGRGQEFQSDDVLHQARS